MVALFVILTIAAFLALDGIVLLVKRQRAAATSRVEATHPLSELLPEPDLPGGVFLAPSHLWVSLMAAGQARVGLDPLVRSALGDPDRIESAVQGTKVAKGDPLFSARWGDRSILFRSPVEGTVESASPSAGQLEPEGWVVTLRPVQAQRDLRPLPMAEEARRWFSQEWARLRDFVAAQSMQAAPAAALPDGGEPASGWMKHEPDPAWDRFIELFLSQRQHG